MKLSPTTIDAVRRSISAQEETSFRLSEPQGDEIKNALLNGEALTNPRLLVLSVQALVSSGQAQTAVQSLLHLLNPRALAVPTAAVQQASGSLDISLFEEFREANALSYEGASESLEYLQAQRPTDAASYRTLAGWVQALAPNLLNTEHQPQAAEVLIDFLERLDDVGLKGLNAESFTQNILRKCFTSPRVSVDLSAIQKLRDIARSAATRALTTGPWPAHIVFRLNVFAGHHDAAVSYLSALDRKAALIPTQNNLNRLINDLTWAHETSLDQHILLAAEHAFFSIGELLPSSYQYLAMATRFGDAERARRWIECWEPYPASVNARYLQAKFHLAFGQFENALNFALRPLGAWAATVPAIQSSPRREIKNIAKRLLGRPITPPMGVDARILYGLIRTTQEARFLKELSDFREASGSKVSLVTVPQKTTLILVPNHLHFLSQLPVVPLEKARHAFGAEIVSCVNGLYPSSPNLSPAAEILRDALIPPYYFRKNAPSHSVSSEWIIDPYNKYISFRGVNYFYGIHNSLGIIFRRFRLNYDDAAVRQQLRRHLTMFQSIHELFGEFVNNLEPDREYRFVVIGLQFGVGYAFRNLIAETKLPNVRIVHASNGFEGFDRKWEIDPEGSNPIASYHSVTDVTDTPNLPLGFRPRKEDCVTTLFETEAEYLKINDAVAAYVNKVDTRANNATVRQRDPNRPRKIVMLGTVLPDLSIPQDSGFVHQDIAHWVRDTAEIARKAGGTVEVVVKQHPAELNPKIGFYVSEKFVDLLPDDRPDNIEVLPYAADFHDAVLNADLVVMWSGTSAIELALMGVPFICCSKFAEEEYALGTPAPSSHDDYVNMLLGSVPVNSSEARLKAIDIVHRTTCSPLRERSSWPKRQLLNAQAWPPRLDLDSALEDLTSGATQRLAKSLVGFP
ncbi:hypothetical protein [uncultured Paracoccus sp.]|uniref:hypothetical protein n=1 Tax=uncultured Paracoccus sp. TaxID=189685 RepID=UPI0026056DF5|nr:hypothetical protein [uncultured Paracoccus sp.]